MHEQFRLWIIIAAAIVQTTFVAIYATRPWFRSFTGRAIFVKASALMLLVDVSVVHAFIDYPAEQTVEDLVYVLVLLGMTWQLIALLYEPRLGRRK